MPDSQRNLYLINNPEDIVVFLGFQVNTILIIHICFRAVENLIH